MSDSEGLTPRQKRLAKQVAKARAEKEQTKKRKEKAVKTSAKNSLAHKGAGDSVRNDKENKKARQYPEQAIAGEPLRLDFAISANEVSQLIDNGSEVAVIGRSNVGKSSLLNALAGRSQGKNELAHTSGTPGRTRLLNVFSHLGGGQVVDLPGYGYAKASKKEREEWHQRMLDYLANREQIGLILSLVDGKVGPSKEDLQLMAWMRQRSLPVSVVVTKIDKLPNTWVDEQLLAIKQSCEVEELYPVSSHSGFGIDRLRDYVRKLLIA